MRLTAASERSSKGLSVDLRHPGFAFRLRFVFFRHVNSNPQKSAARLVANQPPTGARCAENSNARLTMPRRFSRVPKLIPGRSAQRPPYSTIRPICLPDRKKRQSPRPSPQPPQARQLLPDIGKSGPIGVARIAIVSRLAPAATPYLTPAACDARPRPAAGPTSASFSCASGLTHHSVEIVASRVQILQNRAANPCAKSCSRNSCGRHGPARPRRAARRAAARPPSPANSSRAISSAWRASRRRMIEQQRKNERFARRRRFPAALRKGSVCSRAELAASGDRAKPAPLRLCRSQPRENAAGPYCLARGRTDGLAARANRRDNGGAGLHRESGPAHSRRRRSSAARRSGVSSG